MNTKIHWNSAWEFSKENNPDATWEMIDLPHTWNGIDGQDGGDASP